MEGVGCSPVQRLCGRTLLSTATSRLKPMTTPGVREKTSSEERASDLLLQQRKSRTVALTQR